MADNYLEKRYDEVFGKGAKSARPSRPGLDVLLKNNRSCRGYDRSYEVKMLQLRRMIEVNTKIASAMNQQVLRFRPVLRGPEADRVNSLIKMGAALKELNLPFPGTEPEAFIIICSTVPESRFVDMDLGISMQSMSLKAVEMGLNCLMVCNFNKHDLKEALELPYEPLAVLVVGKGAEKIEMVPVNSDQPLDYYRVDSTHYVPKICADDLMIK